ncbi:MAG: acyl-CoA dehydrogenase family protein [Ilumatobacteraceae bacterium]
MSIAITDDHLALGETVADLARKRALLEANSALLEADEETMPAAWEEIASLGWLGLHVPEAHGGSGFGLEELVVVVEELGVGWHPGRSYPR